MRPKAAARVGVAGALSNKMDDASCETELRRVRFLPHGDAQAEALSAFVATHGQGDVGACILHFTSNRKTVLPMLMSTILHCPSASLLFARTSVLMEVLEQTRGDVQSLKGLMDLVRLALSAESASFMQNLDIPKFIRFSADQVASDDLGLSEVASLVVVDSLSSTAPDAVLKEMVHVMSDKLKETESDCMLQLRFATVLSKIMGKSNFHFESCLEVGVVDCIMSLARSPDVLLSICALELLLEIAKTTSGVKYLFEESVVEWLLTLASTSAAESKTDPILSSLALQIACDIFNMAMSSSFDTSSLLAKNGGAFKKMILTSIVGKLVAPDDGGRLSSLHAISNFASMSEDTMQLVIRDANITETWLGLLNTAKIEIKAACLHSVARVLDAECASSTILTTSERSSAQQMKIELLESIGHIKDTPVVAYLVQIAKQPMNELRNASMDVMRSIARGGGWGLELLYLTPSAALSGFRAFLGESLLGGDVLLSCQLLELIFPQPSRHLLQRIAQQSTAAKGASSSFQSYKLSAPMPLSLCCLETCSSRLSD